MTSTFNAAKPRCSRYHRLYQLRLGFIVAAAFIALGVAAWYWPDPNGLPLNTMDRASRVFEFLVTALGLIWIAKICYRGLVEFARGMNESEHTSGAGERLSNHRDAIEGD
jgi:hypothetical protein